MGAGVTAPKDGLTRGPMPHGHTPPHRMNGQLDRTDGIRAGYSETETIGSREANKTDPFKFM